MSKDKNTKLELVTHFTKLFGEKDTSKEEDIPEAERKIYLDATNVCGLIPKKPWVIKALTNLFDVQEPTSPPPLERMWKANAGEDCTSKYGTEYLKVVLDTCKAYDDVLISTRKDSPLKVETEDFIYILAPRVSYTD
ncbi:MAG: hypothetical protein WC307_05960 [Candidatus Nanoarchaeia archaeon]|jgi:hypothetical protein